MTHTGVRASCALRKTARRLASVGVGICVVALGAASWANNLGENIAWQFQTSADKANAAAVQDMVQKKNSGYYAAPVTTNNYSTHIGRQYNCEVSANATGNQGNNSTVANSPNNSGASTQSTGNANSSEVGNRGAVTVDSTQANSGAVGAETVGNTNSYVAGTAWQALNSNQSNSGNQTASVAGSTACVYGALN